MFHSIQIAGYRGLNTFEMKNLGRVNLLVGKNNCGKTSVLEAIFWLQTAGSPAALVSVLRRRGERIVTPDEPDRLPLRPAGVLWDISHSFSGHELTMGSTITITAEEEDRKRKLVLSIAQIDSEEQRALVGRETDDDLNLRMALKLEGTPTPMTPLLPIGRAGGIGGDVAYWRRLPVGASDAAPAYFVGPESLTADELAGLWDQLVLKPTESLVMQALRTLEPRIERIASQSRPASSSRGRGGFIVKLEGIDQPIPIGSLGDGAWRMLALAIALSQCQGGVLLVDEIDTGLHYSVMSQMWMLIYKAAQVLDVQVFATTHSQDCVSSLAKLDAESGTTERVCVQRVEAGNRRSVPYEQEEFAAAAQSGIEVR